MITMNVSYIFAETDSEALNSHHHQHHQVTLPSPIKITLKINSKLIDFELDTGSPVSICSGQYWFKVFGYSAYKDLEEVNVKLKSYTGDSLCILGLKNVIFEYKNHNILLPIYIAKGNGPSLLGRDWLLKVANLQHNSMHSSTILVDHILTQYSQVFHDDDNDGDDGDDYRVNGINAIRVSLPVAENAIPKYCKASVLKNTFKRKVELELNRLESEGIIEPVKSSSSLWATPIIPILKFDNTVRIYGDYKITLNNCFTTEKAYTIPRIEDVYRRLCGRNTTCKYFSKLNITSLYQELQLDDKSKCYTTIITHKGLYQYNFIPYGINCLVHIFYEIFPPMLKGIPNTVAYADDILIGSETVNEHLTTLSLVLSKFQETGLRLKKEKCIFLTDHLDYIGYRLDGNGVHMLTERILPILHLPDPCTPYELKSFLTLFNYYAERKKDKLLNIECLIEPLNELLIKNVEWKWDKLEADCYQKLKEILISPNVLSEFDPGKAIILLCNASAHGIGAILTQKENHVENDAIIMNPVAFASRFLTLNERNYPQTEKEALSIVYAVTQFNQYLFGQHFEICTTHEPLLELFSESRGIQQSNTTSARIQRWAILLSTYNYKLSCIGIKDNLTAQVLSRLPIEDNNDEKILEPSETVSLIQWINSFEMIIGKLHRQTELDSTLSQVKIYTMKGWPKYVDAKYKPYQQRKQEITMKNGCLLYGTRIIIPTACRKVILDKLHALHTKTTDMKESAISYVWWPEIDDDIDRIVQQCDICRQNKSSSVASDRLHSPIEKKSAGSSVQQNLWTKLHIGYFGPVHGYMLLVVIDTCTKWIEIKPARKATSENTIKSLYSIFTSHGVPEYILSDDSPVFLCEEFQLFLHQNNIIHILTDKHNPSSNELANIAVEIVKRGYQKAAKLADFHRQLEKFVFSSHITPQKGEKLSPAELLMGRRLRTSIAFLLQTDSENTEDLSS
ncbi:unnamed protein product [Trichobilharzia szidati]|nr:unnamed protein product [Trichobilharzia szidati]